MYLFAASPIRHILSICLFLMMGSTAFLPAPVTVSGTLLGADGQPMPRAHLKIEGGAADVSFFVEVDTAGYFAFDLPDTGGYAFYAMGVHHETVDLPLIIMEPGHVDLEIKLAASRLVKTPDSVFVVSPSFGEGGLHMSQDAQGAFVATIETQADTLAYQIAGIKTTDWDLAIGSGKTYTLTGTQADHFVLDRSGKLWDRNSHYFSILNVSNKAVEITFDAAALAQRGNEPVVKSEPAYVGEMVSIFLEARMLKRHIDAKVQTQAINESEYRTFVSDQQVPFRDKIEQEKNPLLQQWYIFNFFDRLSVTEADSSLARDLMEQISPTSPFWSFAAWYMSAASNIVFRLAHALKQNESLEAYITQGFETHPDPVVRVQFLYAATGLADYAEREKEKVHYYSRLISEYPDSWQATDLNRRYAKDRKIQAGKTIPEFQFLALSDSSTTYSNTSFEGRVYLIDVWGTWCSPCVEEMPYLHEAYAAFHDRDFDILSVAMMDTAEDIAAFREASYPMPWQHTLVASEEAAAVRSLFEVAAFPKTILVDQTGRILAVSEAVRGEKLMETLTALFDK